MTGRLFAHIKKHHPNIFALYVTTSIVLIWSGVWCIAETWARGDSLLSSGAEFKLGMLLRFLCLLVMGCWMLYADDRSLEELMMMRRTAPAELPRSHSRREKFFYHFKTRYPNLAAIYTISGIILAWCGIWGMVWSIPMQILWRSLLSICLGFFLLYIEDGKLDEF